MNSATFIFNKTKYTIISHSFIYYKKIRYETIETFKGHRSTETWEIGKKSGEGVYCIIKMQIGF